MYSIHPSVYFRVQLKCFLNVSDILIFKVQKNSFGILLVFGFEDSHCLVRRNHFEGAKAVENAVKDLSEDIVGKGADSSLIYNLVALQIDVIFTMLDNSIFLHSVNFPLDVASLAFIVVIQFNKRTNVEIPVVNNFRGHNSSGSLVSSVQSMAFSRDSSYQLAADSTGS